VYNRSDKPCRRDGSEKPIVRKRAEIGRLDAQNGRQAARLSREPMRGPGAGGQSDGRRKMGSSHRSYLRRAGRACGGPINPRRRRLRDPRNVHYRYRIPHT